MICLTLTDRDGKTVTPRELASVAELQETADKARVLVRECERLVQLKAVKKPGGQGGVPYLS